MIYSYHGRKSLEGLFRGTMMMELQLTLEDRKKIEDSIRQKYAKAAVSPEGLFRYPTGRAGLEALDYDTEIVLSLPDAVAASYCGVGNPFKSGPIHKGENVLDVGCGAGVDTIVAAILVGPNGSVTGSDIVPEMLARAEVNARAMNLRNVNFVEASSEQLPLLDAGFEVVISNGVFNLIPDKLTALSEVFRVLKPKGRFMVADQILAGKQPESKEARIKSWYQ
jgi:SAM-dependent methyltransferase